MKDLLDSEMRNMRNFLHKIFGITLFMTLTNCATGVLELTSQPSESEVFLVDSNGAKSTLGKTPVVTDSAKLFDRADKGFVQISVEKEGYASQAIIFPRTVMGSNHKINLNLKESDATRLAAEAPKLDQCQEISQDSMNKLSEGIASAQAAILRKNYEVALVRIGDLISRHPSIAVLYDLQGNIYYLQNQYPKALKAYQTSLKLVPSNMETAIMARRLGELGGNTTGNAH